MKPSGRWIVALTGASGMRYGLSLLRALGSSSAVQEVHVMVSEAGQRVLAEEEDLKYSPSNPAALLSEPSDKFSFFSVKDIGAPCASGTFLCDGMVVVPCSMATLAAIASGFSQNLIHRAADVTMKEGRKLILVPRETPLSAVHLENMLKLAQLGVSIVPAMPGFYSRPDSIDDLIDMQVMKILDIMRVDNNQSKRWCE
ncbi:MAG: UbiX family flavin prenyltransferase [Deltaproteobacteria bacterium]|nr:UbiX family flavin prenyltransferase [Deltaproteobacteria bacterium]